MLITYKVSQLLLSESVCKEYMRTTVQYIFVVLFMILSISFFSSHQLMIVIFQRDQLRLGVDEIMDRFNPSVKHHTYEVHFIPVVRRMGSER